MQALLFSHGIALQCYELDSGSESHRSVRFIFFMVPQTIVGGRSVGRIVKPITTPHCARRWLLEPLRADQ